MQFAADRLKAPTAIRTDLGAIFISLLVWTGVLQAHMKRSS